jgi:hypothetical protein
MRAVIFGLFFCSILFGVKEPKGDFTVKADSGGSFEVFAIKDKDGLLEKYRADITAPVCEDRICYDVNIAFNWNLFGEFKDFEIRENDPLTKLDHKPFLPEDYQKLQSILASRDLNFVKVPASELVEKSDKPKLDGYSGATKETVKKEVIGGAIFTCYTLWHIANGAVIDSIKNHTGAALSRQLISKIAKQKSSTGNYFIINALNEQGYYENMDEILALLVDSKGYFAKNAIEKIPKGVFETKPAQQFVVSNFRNLDYFTQKALLLKLELVSLFPELRQFFIEQIDIQNSLKNQQLVSLSLRKINIESFEKLVEKLVLNKIQVSEKNYIMLQKLAKEFNLTIDGIEKL